MAKNFESSVLSLPIVEKVNSLLGSVKTCNDEIDDLVVRLRQLRRQKRALISEIDALADGLESSAKAMRQLARQGRPSPRSTEESGSASAEEVVPTLGDNSIVPPRTLGVEEALVQGSAPAEQAELCPDCTKPTLTPKTLARQARLEKRKLIRAANKVVFEDVGLTPEFAPAGLLDTRGSGSRVSVPPNCPCPLGLGFNHPALRDGVVRSDYFWRGASRNTSGMNSDLKCYIEDRVSRVKLKPHTLECRDRVRAFAREEYFEKIAQADRRLDTVPQ